MHTDVPPRSVGVSRARVKTRRRRQGNITCDHIHKYGAYLGCKDCSVNGTQEHQQLSSWIGEAAGQARQWRLTEKDFGPCVWCSSAGRFSKAARNACFVDNAEHGAEHKESQLRSNIGTASQRTTNDASFLFRSEGGFAKRLMKSTNVKHLLRKMPDGAEIMERGKRYPSDSMTHWCGGVLRCSSTRKTRRPHF